MSIKVYCARAMSGRKGNDLVNEALFTRNFLTDRGIEVLDPVLEEKVKANSNVVQATREQMVKFWKRDKQMIREADVLLDLTPLMKSEGVTHEIGYARYHLWKPVVRVFPIIYDLPSGSVAYFEDDVIAFGLQDAVRKVHENWGTWFKRFVWRVKLYNRCWLKSKIYRLMEWF